MIFDFAAGWRISMISRYSGEFLLKALGSGDHNLVDAMVDILLTSGLPAAALKKAQYPVSWRSE
jgi:hypothetical protein